MYWVINKKIAVASTPLGREDVEKWAREGVRAVVSLLNEADIPPSWASLEEVHRAVRDAGLELYYYPVLSKRAPPIDVAVRIIKWIDEMLEKNKPVVIVCGRGWGRGGAIIASYLVYKGSEPSKAVEFVNSRAVRAGGEPIESQEQLLLPYRVREALEHRASK